MFIYLLGAGKLYGQIELLISRIVDPLGEYRIIFNRLIHFK